MADYYQLKNQNIFNPPANTVLGTANNQFTTAYVQEELILGNVAITGSTINTPKISTIVYPGDDTAADTAGGQTITLSGSGFVSGASVLINNVAVSVVTVVNSATITFTSPPNNTGSYVVYVINPDGGTAVAIPGIQYSGTPTWTTPAGSLGSLYETQSFNSTVSATGDAPVTYSVLSGTLPPGATFNSNGTITGTSQLLSSPTTYNFTVRATDAERQDTSRSFSLTINPDVVTWVSPANGTSYTSIANTAISNITLSATSAVGSGIAYTANSLPTGISLSGNTISGTPTVASNTSSLLTATANTTNELSSITINWVINVANDIYFKYVSLLLPGASTTFVDDSSTNNFAVTINGDTKPNNFNPYTPGYYSNYFDGTGDYLSTPANSAFVFGTGDFTIEAWIYRTASGATFQAIITNWSTGWFFGFNNGILTLLKSGGTPVISDSVPSPLNSWNHCCVSRSGSTVRLFVDGVLKSTVTDANDFSGNNTIYIGITDGTNHAFTGYISNLRVVKGTAVYTSAFTPPTQPLTAITNTSILTCQSNRFIDNSTNNFSITRNGDTRIDGFDPFIPNSSYATYGSGYFDGSGDYLTVPTNAAFDFGTGDFTVEAWIFLPTVTDGCFLGGSTVGAIDLAYTSNSFRFGRYNTAWDSTFNYTLLPNQWYHVAFVKSSGVASVYVNGSSIGSLANTVNYGTLGGTVRINISGDGSRQFSGYISNHRIVKGTAVYTANFTPPSTPLTAISGTSLLTLQNNQSVNNNVFLDSSTNNFFITRNGNTTQGSYSPYGGGWSNYFDGNGDYLSFSNNTAFAFGTGSYTIEFWINGPLSSDTFFLSGRAAIGTMHITTGGTASPAGVLRYVGSSTIVSSNVIMDNTWHHCAIVRNGSSNITLYVDGVSRGTGTDTTNYTGTSGTWYIASNDVSVPSNILTGYISNLRIVKGTAVYTTNFTPSTTPLTAISGTSLLTSQSNRFIDNSTNNFTITRVGDTRVQKFNPFGIITTAGTTQAYTPSVYGGSMYFDGTTDYLTSSASASNQMTGNFTVEVWAYPINTISSEQGLITITNTSSSGSNGMAIFVNTTNKVGFFIAGNGTTLSSSNNVITPNAWNHIALVRSGSTNTLYVNGVSVLTNATTPTWPATPSIGIGREYNDNTGVTFNGYLSDVRIVKGTALYTSNFVPPTTPLTAIQNTALLLNGTGAGIADASTNNVLETVGDTKLSTAVSKFGGSSMSFDGSGDMLTTNGIASSGIYNRLTASGVVNTIECWVYLNAFNSPRGTICASWTSSGQLGWTYDVDTSGDIFISNNGQGSTVSLSTKITTGSWLYLAFVNDGTNIKIYLNGLTVGTQAVLSPTSYIGPLTIGNRSDATLSFNGYIQDFRITQGVARYTGNFTPPTQPLTTF